MKKLLFVVAALAVSTSQMEAQSCAIDEQAIDPRSAYCNAVIHAAEVAQPIVGIGFAAGNPIPGASSTLGMRLGKIPRLTLAGRMSGAFLETPNVERRSDSGTRKGLARSLNVDAAVGVLSGWSLAPTIGGFGSLDVIASAGTMSLPGEFTEKPASWAVGARVGILRESFTAPGISVTGMYRSIGDYRYGTTNPGVDAASFELRDNSVTSLRAIIGKRLFVIGANVGVGYDKYSSKALAVVGGDAPTALVAPTIIEPSHTSVFANLVWTMLLLNVVAEGGYQRGGDAFTAPMSGGHTSRTENSSYYGSLAVRLAL